MKLDATVLRPATLTPPLSKSDAHRALALAWMLDLPAPALHGPVPDDVRRIATGLAGLGSRVDCGDGAAPFRILLALAAFLPGRTTVFHGSDRLSERPHGPLFDALRGLGATVDGNRWPLRVVGSKPSANHVVIDTSVSSQYASALLLAGCSAVRRWGEPFSVELRGPQVSRGYLDITLRWARAAGFEIDDGLTIRAWRPVRSLPPIPSDASSLGYLLLIARASGSTIESGTEADHPDAAVHGYLDARTLDVVVSRAPDLAPTLCALALTRPGAHTFRDVSILRHKESDRLAAIQELTHAAGGTTRLDGDTLTVASPGTPPASFTFNCRDDHRLTLTAVTLACLFRCRADLSHTSGVDKSFPGFFEQVARCGVLCS